MQLKHRAIYLCLAAFYFFKMGILGTLLPFFQLYLDHLKFSKFQTGIILSLLAVTRIGVPLLWGRLADRTGKAPLLASILMFISTVLFAGLFWAQSFWGVFIVTLLAMLFRTGVLPLVEAISQRFCQKHDYIYGRIRVWGTLGFFAAVFLGGYLIKFYPLSIILWVILFLGGLAGLSVLCLHFAHSTSFVEPTLDLHRPWFKLMVGVLVVCFLMQLSHGAYYGYFSLYLKGLGYEGPYIAYLWAPCLLAELLIMVVWAPRLKIVHPISVLGFSLFMATLRWALLAYFPKLPLIFLSQILHAFTYGTFHLAVMEFIRRKVPCHLKATGQTLYSTVTYGLGNTVGFILMGKLGDIANFTTMFGVSSVIAGVGLIVIIMVKFSRMNQD
ncbi:MAG: MFS transporter [Deltaproteobacteria bacterium]|nr:MFS transporter [Deltaproteobacteria bacterium]